jgi:hypothetical protein
MLNQQPTKEKIQQSIENLEQNRFPYADFHRCQNKCQRNCVTIAGLVHPDWLPRLEAVTSGAGFNTVSQLLSYLIEKHIMGINCTLNEFCQPISAAEEEQINKPYPPSPQRIKDCLNDLEMHRGKYVGDFEGCPGKCERNCVVITANVHPEWLPRLESQVNSLGFDTVGGLIGYLTQVYILGVDPFKEGHMCQPILKPTEPDPICETLPFT